jgi:Methyltransferase domain/C-methyltransferase C-terminal domain
MVGYPAGVVNRPAVLLTSCPACDSDNIEPFFALHELPVHGQAVFETPEAARAVAKGDQILTSCAGCGLIFNRAYDGRLLEYSAHHEESQAFSPRFLAYMRELSTRWVAEYDLAGRTVCEVGCGKGAFLAEMVRAGAGLGVGIDPGFRPDQIPPELSQQIEVVTELFRPQHVPADTGAVACRHTLEHIPRPVEFVQLIASGMRPAGAKWFLAEVPDMWRILGEGAFWDLQYEHCSYWTTTTFARMLAMSGLDPVRSYLTYDDQYVVAEASTAHDPGDPLPGTADELRGLAERARHFATMVDATLQRWGAWFAELDGRNVAVWGGGAKGVTFLNALLPDCVHRVVDVNPGLQGNYLAGVALPIVSPASLRDDPPDDVLLMNPIYLGEVRTMLDDLGLASTTLTAV